MSTGGECHEREMDFESIAKPVTLPGALVGTAMTTITGNIKDMTVNKAVAVIVSYVVTLEDEHNYI